MSDEPNRRRHARAPAPVSITVTVDGKPLCVARVIDVSIGGCFVELGEQAQRTAGVLAPVEPPLLSSRGRAVIAAGGVVVERGARVVRIRWGGRERGGPVAPAVALVFDDKDDVAAAKLEDLLR